MEWNKIAWMIGSAILSGLLATIISIFCQRRSEAKRRKMVVFETLMRNRFSIASRESVEALNLIDIVFYDSKKIRAAYNDFLIETNRPEDGRSTVGDKFLALLERISCELGMKGIQWESIKRCYFPIGLAEQLRDEEVLRKLQIQSAVQEIKRKTAIN